MPIALCQSFIPMNLKKFLINNSKINDAIYVIAPETGQTLQSLVELAEQTGKNSLNCESHAIRKAADKTILYEVLQKLGVSPKTVILSMDDGLTKIKETIKKELRLSINCETCRWSRLQRIKFG